MRQAIQGCGSSTPLRRGRQGRRSGRWGASGRPDDRGRPVPIYDPVECAEQAGAGIFAGARQGMTGTLNALEHRLPAARREPGPQHIESGDRALLVGGAVDQLQRRTRLEALLE